MHFGWTILGRALAKLAFAVFFAGAGGFVRAGETVQVEIRTYQYLPQEVRVKVGEVVQWVNREKRTSHSILFPAEGGRESDRIFPDETWQRSFDKPGSYPYTCGPHPEMKGVVLVTE